MTAEGVWQDGDVRTDADGYASEEAPWYARWVLRAAERLRRRPDARWFALIGVIVPDVALPAAPDGVDDVDVDAVDDVDEQDVVHHSFVIGSNLLFVPETSGVLYCFANDALFMYWNNSGAVYLRVTEAS
jgi:hypothetical protein